MPVRPNCEWHRWEILWRKPILQVEGRRRERNPAVKRMIAQAIRAAKADHRKIGICGQAPSDYPDFAQFLVEQGIDSISLNPDTVLKTTLAILEKEKALDAIRAVAPLLEASDPPGRPAAVWRGCGRSRRSRTRALYPWGSHGVKRKEPIMASDSKMRANVFRGVNDIRVEEVPRPRAGPGEAVIRVTLTTICGTDLHILRGEYPVRPGLVIGHEPVGVIAELGPGVTGYKVGDRVLVGAITPCGQCEACLSGHLSQCGHGHGYEAIGGWRFGNTINGAQAEYLLVPYAQANLAKIPDGLTDEQVVLLADIASTGFGGAEAANIRLGDTAVVFAQGPIGLCATAGAKLMGAALVIGVDGDEARLAMSRRMGADVALDFRNCDVISEVKKLTGGGADVAIEALGTQQTFESCLRCLRPGGTLSSLGVYSGKLLVPYDAFAAGLGDHRIVTTLCPGGKERMRRLMNMVRSGRFDPTPLLTHSYKLDNIVEAYQLFGERRDGVMKVAIRP
jgi:alcohol dehydrogenase